MINAPSNDAWFTVPVGDVRDLTSEAAQTSVRIQQQMLRTALNHGDFAHEIVNILTRELGLTAATLFIRTRGLNAFSLKAASGFDYSLYDSFLLRNPSYPSLACESPTPTILVAFPPFTPDLYRNLYLIEGRDISALVVVPFTPPDRSDTDYPDPLGALCLYVPDGSDIDRIVSISGTLQTLVGTLYIASLEQQCMHLRNEAVRAAAFESRLTKVATNLLRLTCQQLNFSAGSVWLLDPRRQYLQLRAAYPKRRPACRDVTSNVVRLEDGVVKDSNPLAIAFHTLHKVHYPPPTGADGGTRRYATFNTEKIIEDYGQALHNTLAVPLRTDVPVMLGHLNRSAVGVMTFSNKRTTLGEITHFTPTTWEDLKLVSYMAEIATVLVFQGLQVLDHEADYERRIHGLKINLMGARDMLVQLEDRAEIRTPDSRMDHHLSNAIEWIREIEQQVGRADSIERLKVIPEPIPLTASLAKAVRAARIYARARRIPGFSIDADDALSTGMRPPVILADKRAIQTIFRNLFENSIKYRDQNANECRVNLSIQNPAGASTLTIQYIDNGVGISPNDASHLFDLGFRGIVARRVNVQGEGIGLYECRVLMEAMGGEIACIPRPRGTEFVLTFPTVSTSPRKG